MAPRSADSTAEEGGIWDQLAAGNTSGVVATEDGLRAVIKFDETISRAAEEGHPEYGHFSSMEELYASAEKLALAFAPDDTWVARQLKWTVQYQDNKLEFDTLPIAALCPGQTPSGNQLEDAYNTAAEYNLLIEEQANYALGLLRESACDYIRTAMHKRSRGEGYVDWVPRSETGEPQRQQESEYVAMTAFSAGQHRYIINFQSRDYPMLEDALVTLRQLREQRREAVLSILH